MVMGRVEREIKKIKKKNNFYTVRMDTGWLKPTTLRATLLN
jgi:hypothetical protein